MLAALTDAAALGRDSTGIREKPRETADIHVCRSPASQTATQPLNVRLIRGPQS